MTPIKIIIKIQFFFITHMCLIRPSLYLRLFRPSTNKIFFVQIFDYDTFRNNEYEI